MKKLITIIAIGATILFTGCSFKAQTEYYEREIIATPEETAILIAKQVNLENELQYLILDNVTFVQKNARAKNNTVIIDLKVINTEKAIEEEKGLRFGDSFAFGVCTSHPGMRALINKGLNLQYNVSYDDILKSEVIFIDKAKCEGLEYYITDNIDEIKRRQKSKETYVERDRSKICVK